MDKAASERGRTADQTSWPREYEVGAEEDEVGVQ